MGIDDTGGRKEPRMNTDEHRFFWWRWDGGLGDDGGWG